MIAKLLLAIPLLLGGFAIFAYCQSTRHARQLAAKRAGITPSALIDGLVADGITEAVAEFVWDALGIYYAEGDLLPHPDDDLTDDAGIDPEDIEDIVALFFRQFSLREPTKQKPETIPAPLRIAGFARYLDRKLQEEAQ